MKKKTLLLIGLVFLILNVNGQTTKEKLCKTWHMYKTVEIYTNAPSTINWLGEEYRLSYLKFDSLNMTWAEDGMSKQNDGSYKEYYVYTGTWKLFNNQETLVKYNNWQGAANKSDTYKIISVTDKELILLSDEYLNKSPYEDGTIGDAFITIYFSDK